MDVIRRTPVTAALSVWVVILWLIDPALEGLSYYLLAPWTHDGWTHLDQNLVMLVVFGGIVEWWVGWRRFGAVSLVTAYLTLFGAVALGLGGWANGTSGLTNVYLAFVGMVVASEFNRRVGSANEVVEWAVVLGFFAGLMLFAIKVIVVGGRLLGAVVPPENVAVGVHALGLVLGGIWFASRRVSVEVP